MTSPQVLNTCWVTAIFSHGGICFVLFFLSFYNLLSCFATVYILVSTNYECFTYILHEGTLARFTDANTNDNQLLCRGTRQEQINIFAKVRMRCNFLVFLFMSFIILLNQLAYVNIISACKLQAQHFMQELLILRSIYFTITWTCYQSLSVYTLLCQNKCKNMCGLF